MSLQLQNITDRLAARLGRAALLEDTRHRVLAHSEHIEPLDEVRHTSILRRHTSLEIIDRLRVLGIYEAREPVRTPACPHVRMLPRVCVPVRHADRLLGFLWFIDADGSMTDDEIALAMAGARRLAEELQEERFAAESASRRETSAVRDLLDGDREPAARAARYLAEEARLGRPAWVVALVIRPIVRAAEEPGERTRAILARALASTRWWLGPQLGWHLVRDDHGVLLVAGGPEPSRVAIDRCAERLAKELSVAYGGVEPAPGTTVGVGQPRPRLAEARDTYQEALRAARVGSLVPTVGLVAHWSRLGIYRTLAELAPDRLSRASAHPGLERLFRDDSKLHLLETLETYLDLAGNAHATAEHLHMHRATLYYRLHRVEELVAANLKDGNDRLCLHLALKLGRLSGRYQPRPAGWPAALPRIAPVTT